MYIEEIDTIFLPGHYCMYHVFSVISMISPIPAGFSQNTYVYIYIYIIYSIHRERERQSKIHLSMCIV